MHPGWYPTKSLARLRWQQQQEDLTRQAEQGRFVNKVPYGSPLSDSLAMPWPSTTHRNGDGGLNEEEFFDFLNPEGGWAGRASHASIASG